MNNFDIFQLLLINKDDNNHVDIDILLQKTVLYIYNIVNAIYKIPFYFKFWHKLHNKNVYNTI